MIFVFNFDLNAIFIVNASGQCFYIWDHVYV